jgi:hypothetical protein
VEKIKELHVRVRREGQDCTSLLSHGCPLLHRVRKEMTGHQSILNAEKCPRELMKAMPLDEAVMLNPCTGGEQRTREHHRQS